MANTTQNQQLAAVKLKRFLYNPHSKQLLFHKDKHRFRLLSCGYGTGKSLMTVVEAYLMATQQFPGGKGLLVAPTENMLASTLIEAWRKIVPYQLYTINLKDKKIKLYNGSEIYLRSSEKYITIEGLSVSWVCMDEYSRELRKEAFDTIFGRLREVPGSRAVFCGTPNGIEHPLLKKFGLCPDNKRFFGTDDYFYSKDYATIRASSTDNPYIPRDYLANLLQNSPEWIDQYVHGKYVTRAGLVYNLFDPRKHMISPEDLPKKYHNIYMGADYGYNAPGCLMVIGEVINGRDRKYYIVEEHYKRNIGYNKQGWGAIFLAAAKRYRPQFIVFDSSSPEQIQAMREATNNMVNILPCPKKDNITAISKIQNLFQADKLFISTDCDNLRTELLTYSYKATRTGTETDEPDLKGSDHAIDAVKYAFARILRLSETA